MAGNLVIMHDISKANNLVGQNQNDFTYSRKETYTLEFKNSLQNQRTHDMHLNSTRPVPTRLVFIAEVTVKKQYSRNNTLGSLVF